MAMIVPGVARFTIEQTLEGRNVANVLDYRIDTTGSTMSREEALEAQAGSIADQWIDLLIPFQVDDLQVVRVSYVDLNSADGETGEVVSGDGWSLPASGGASSSGLPGNTAVLVTKQTTGGRARRNGRLYWAGITEAATDAANGNQLASAEQAAMATAWASFLANTNELDTLGTAFSSEMQVVHITARDADDRPTAGVGTPVTALGVDELLATQRRRLRR